MFDAEADAKEAAKAQSQAISNPVEHSKNGASTHSGPAPALPPTSPEDVDFTPEALLGRGQELQKAI